MPAYKVYATKSKFMRYGMRKVKTSLADNECAICTEEFCAPAGTSTEAHAEKAVKLTCGHVFGADCVKTWASAHNSCPACRRALYELAPTAEQLGGPIRRALFTGGTLGFRVIRAMGTQYALDHIALDLAMNFHPETVFNMHAAWNVERERTYPRDMVVMQEARSIALPETRGRISRTQVLQAITEHGTDTNRGFTINLFEAPVRGRYLRYGERHSPPRGSS